MLQKCQKYLHLFIYINIYTHIYTRIEGKNSLAVNDVFNLHTVLTVIYSIQQLSN